MIEEQNGNTAVTEPVKRVQKIDAQGRAYATGKRKSSISRVWIKVGSGKITINKSEERRAHV